MKRWAWMLVLLVGCGSDKDGPVDVEGDEAGECADGADNDSNGDFDCDDAGCEGSPDCEASDEGDEGSDDDGPATGDDDAGETGGSDTSGEADDGGDTSGDDDGGDDSTTTDTGEPSGSDDDSEVADDDTSVADDAEWGVDFGAGADDDGDGYRASVDCDDTDPTVHPDAEEVCDGVDNDCNGMLDEGDTALSEDVMLVFYLDADGDGFGVPEDTALGCEAPDGYAENPDDCNDDNPDSTLIRPWYMDADDDGFGDPEVFLELCDQPVGYIPDFSDCDDAREDISPVDPELWGDSIDNDCDEEIDEDDGIEGTWSGTIELTVSSGSWGGTTTCRYAPTTNTCSGVVSFDAYTSDVGAVAIASYSCTDWVTSHTCYDSHSLHGTAVFTSTGGTYFSGSSTSTPGSCTSSGISYPTMSGRISGDGFSITVGGGTHCVGGGYTNRFPVTSGTGYLTKDE